MDVLALRAWKGSAGLKITGLYARFDLKLTENANPTIFVRGIQYEYTGLGFPTHRHISRVYKPISEDENRCL